LPAVNIRQTSDQLYGQIYVPIVKGLMMVATVLITIAFRSSDRLAGAYGTAVSTTMLLTSCLLLVAMRRIWNWSAPAVALAGAVFLSVDGVFFCANLLKIADGGWLPLTLGALIFCLMLTWRTGMDALRNSLLGFAQDSERLLAELTAGNVPRVPGTAVFLTRSAQKVPRILAYHVAQMGALQRYAVTLRVVFEETPRVAQAERWTVQPIGPGLWQAVIRFGFIEIPDLSSILACLSGLDPAMDLEHAVYFGTRDLVVRKPGSTILGHARLALFAFLYRNAVKVVDRFNLPAHSVVEVARLLEI
jgi:KUP system potassium uptake protein